MPYRTIGWRFIHDCLIYMFHAWLAGDGHEAILLVTERAIFPSCKNTKCLGVE